MWKYNLSNAVPHYPDALYLKAVHITAFLFGSNQNFKFCHTNFQCVLILLYMIKMMETHIAISYLLCDH